ncbi:Uncharacterised protein [Vibrio cholerae]|nr:Uncharacterised protein [Vibrio cholerae]
MHFAWSEIYLVNTHCKKQRTTWVESVWVSS